MRSLALNALHDLQKVLRRARQPVELADDERVAFADVVKGGFKLGSGCD
jgi:hypothetical protein